MKKYDRGWASLETGAALLIVMLLIAWGAGIWQDYIQTKGWQTEARLVRFLYSSISTLMMISRYRIGTGLRANPVLGVKAILVVR